MDPKASELIDELKKKFHNWHIEYCFEHELHKFRLNRDGPSQWLYVARNFLEDHTMPELLTNIRDWKIPEAFRGSSQNRWLFLSEAGVKEVDDRFGRGH